MKKLTLGFMVFALAAATLFTTSCKDDDDEEDSKISELSASVKDGKFSTSLQVSIRQNRQAMQAHRN